MLFDSPGRDTLAMPYSSVNHPTVAWRRAACVVLPVSSCSAAPSQDILGSFFPAWLLCAAIGVLAAVLCRRLLAIAGLNDHLLVPPLVYLALAVAVTLLIWLTWFGG